MKYFTTITSKGQITLPADIRRQWQVQAGQKVMVEINSQGQAVVQPLVDLDDIRRRTQSYLAEQGLDTIQLRQLASQTPSGLAAHLQEHFCHE